MAHRHKPQELKVNLKIGAKPTIIQYCEACEQFSLDGREWYDQHETAELLLDEMMGRLFEFFWEAIDEAITEENRVRITRHYFLLPDLLRLGTIEGFRTGPNLEHSVFRLILKPVYPGPEEKSIDDYRKETLLQAIQMLKKQYGIDLWPHVAPVIRETETWATPAENRASWDTPLHEV